MKRLVAAMLFGLAALGPGKAMAQAQLPDSTSDGLRLPAGETPNLHRIKIATVGARDAEETAALYEQWLGYRIVERISITEDLAESWGTPTMAGRPSVLMQSQSGADVFLRTVSVTVPEDHRAMASHGWNAIEIIVEDPNALTTKLDASPFRRIGGPANLGGGTSSIRAVQFAGPSEEVFYFTTETGDRAASALLTPRAEVDRVFIMVVGGPDARAMTDWYRDILGSYELFYRDRTLDLLADAQGVPQDTIFGMGFVALRAFSHWIQIDGYHQNTGPRTTGPGELPPGVSITSFAVNDLDQIDAALFITPPLAPEGMAYGGNRTATIIGPAGELIELIEEK